MNKGHALNEGHLKIYKKWNISAIAGQILLKVEPKQYTKKQMKMTSNKPKRIMNLLACSASVAFSPAQANCLILCEIDSSQLVYLSFYLYIYLSYILAFSHKLKGVA